MPTKPQHSRGYVKLPALLRTIREEANLSQRALGERLDKPQSWIYCCEAGIRRVDLSEFCDWCRACGLEPLAGVKRFLRAQTR